MRKYNWSAVKALEFINSRVLDLEIRQSFIQQLTAYESRLNLCGIGPITSKWSEVSDKTTNTFENEELLLRNTYLNAQMGPFADFSTEKGRMRELKVKWADEIEHPLAVPIETKSKEIDSRNTITTIKSESVHQEGIADEEAKLIKPIIQAADINNKEKVNIIIQPKYNNFIDDNIQDTSITKDVKQEDKPIVTQVISQSNVNNFIINNPAKIEFIGVTPSKGPEIKIHIQKTAPGFSAIRKIIAEKSSPSRPFSAVIRRESPKTKKVIKKERRSAIKNIALDQSLKGSLIASFKKETPERIRMKQFSKGPIKANLRIPIKQEKGKKETKKKRMQSPNNFLKNMVVANIKKTPTRNINARQIQTVTYPAMVRGLSPSNK